MRTFLATFLLIVFSTSTYGQEAISKSASDAAYEKLNERVKAAATQPAPEPAVKPVPKFAGNGGWTYSLQSHQGNPMLSFTLEAAEAKYKKPVLRVDLYVNRYAEVVFVSHPDLRTDPPEKKDANPETNLQLSFDSEEFFTSKCQVREHAVAILGFVGDESESILGAVANLDKLAVKFTVVGGKEEVATFDLRGLQNMIDQTLDQLRREASAARAQAKKDEENEKKRPKNIETMEDLRRFDQLHRASVHIHR